MLTPDGHAPGAGGGANVLVVAQCLENMPLENMPDLLLGFIAGEEIKDMQHWQLKKMVST